MKLAQWEHPEMDLEKQTHNFWQNAKTFARDLHQAITVVFPKTVDWNKIQACSQKSDEPVNDYYNQRQIVFKESSCLSSDVDSTQVAFNSMFINGLQ